MAKMTLLEMVQDILSAMDSDEVNSINDTIESQQVATQIKHVYLDMVTALDIPTQKGMFTATALGDTAHPNYLQLPVNTQFIEWFKYNRETTTDTDLNYTLVNYLSPEDFQELVSNRSESDSNVIVVSDFDGTDLLILNDTGPRYWTSFDDTYIICDAYDSAIDSTLQASKSMFYGDKIGLFTMSDSFIPPIPAKHFPLLFQSAKAQCFAEVKQVINQKAERMARRQTIKYQKDKKRVQGEDNGYYAFRR